MKLISTIIVVLVATGCTSLKSIEMSPEQLQERIVAGDVIKVGDDVRIFTEDGENHEFKVTAISDDQVSGSDGTVSVGDIVALETREFSGGKTALFAGSSLALVLVIAAVTVAGLSF